MIELLRNSQKRRVFKVIVDPIGAIYQIIFCRKIAGQHGWERRRVFYRREGTPSLRRARRAMLAAMERDDLSRV